MMFENKMTLTFLNQRIENYHAVVFLLNSDDFRNLMAKKSESENG